ncbi:lisH domain-containing protein C1711.05-like [Ostrinia furnacalis]|uniref:lisH domain-containing protein C1711.05-like n=1 Tax=Ostrinia furnacalis TaxID=93504 RepID=UPI00103EE2DF|nr:lisH domain-containing protein C1711.05-like [Ostrinia furnacalis]
MPLMRIRSVEIVFEDEMSACTDTALLDRSIELIVSDSDDSTKCVDDLEHANEGNEDTATLNAEGDLSDDNSVSKDNSGEVAETKTSHADDSTKVHDESVTIDDISLNVSEVVDSGRFTEDASSSHLETVPILAYEDALLSHSFDAITVDTAMTTYEISDDSFSKRSAPEARLYEYIDSDSDSSEDTAVCDADAAIQHLTSFHDTMTPDEHTLCDSSDLQYDSFIDMGKF